MSLTIDFSRGFGRSFLSGATTLKSTKEKLGRQTERDSKVAFYEAQKQNLKKREAVTLEDIAQKLEMYHTYENEIAAAKQAYNNSQMSHILDEAEEVSEKRAKEAEKNKPKTEQEKKEASKTDIFYHGLSSAVEKADGKGTGDILGLTTIPYSSMMSYGMTAQYSEKSTEEDPVIRISCNYGGEQRYYDVHVNKVNPKSASQLEMFALSCYMDDKGLTDGGTFGSYNKMKTYADNAAYNKMCPDLQNPKNSSVELDWISMLKEMAQVYLGNEQTYQQYLSADRLADALSEWSQKFSA